MSVPLPGVRWLLRERGSKEGLLGPASAEPSEGRLIGVDIPLSSRNLIGTHFFLVSETTAESIFYKYSKEDLTHTQK